MKESALFYHAVLPKGGCGPGAREGWDTCSIPSRSSSDPRPESLQRSTAQRAQWSNDPADGLSAAARHQTKGTVHFPQSSAQAQPSTCGCGFHRQCPVCVWKAGSVGAVGYCSVCVKVLFEKKIYTPVGSVSCNPFFTTTVHILQGHFLSHTGTSWKTYKFKRKDLPIV